MGIFSSIASKISQLAHSAIGSANAAESTSAASSTDSTAKASMSSVDVESVLKSLADKAGQSLNYKDSIVDLLKLLGLDSSLDSRKKLAEELGYTGDKNDTAAMNVWLIKQVYTELSKNGGSLPSNWGH